MLGDYSEILNHLNTARKHADQAETEGKPAIYREAIDEVIKAVELLMRNTQEMEGAEYKPGDDDTDIPALK